MVTSWRDLEKPHHMAACVCVVCVCIYIFYFVLISLELSLSLSLVSRRKKGKVFFFFASFLFYGTHARVVPSLSLIVVGCSDFHEEVNTQRATRNRPTTTPYIQRKKLGHTYTHTRLARMFSFSLFFLLFAHFEK